MFISIEAPDGAGKTVQARILRDILKSEGFPVLLTREPGGSAGAEDIRRLILEGDAEKWSPETEILLFTAARRDHLEKTILPALQEGMVVITDRFADSTRVYQGAARSDLRKVVDDLHHLMIGMEPDLTILIDIDLDEATRRRYARSISENGDRFEDFGSDFQQRLHMGYRQIAEEFPQRCVTVSGMGSIDQVSARIAAETIPRVIAFMDAAEATPVPA